MKRILADPNDPSRKSQTKVATVAAILSAVVAYVAKLKGWDIEGLPINDIAWLVSGSAIAWALNRNRDAMPPKGNES
jgi:hypothetical protein